LIEVFAYFILSPFLLLPLAIRKLVVYFGATQPLGWLLCPMEEANPSLGYLRRLIAGEKKKKDQEERKRREKEKEEENQERKEEGRE
jgi:hypothetical protein